LKGYKFMKLDMEDISSVEKKLTITIDKKEVAAEYNKALLNITKNAAIKGFRKGKAPRSIIEKSYADKMREDLVSKLIEGSFQKALKEKKLMPVTQPSIKVESFNKDEDFTYSMTVELMPEFELADYSGFVLKGDKVEIKDSEIEDALKSLQEQYAIFKETAEDKKAASGDMVIFDFKGILSDGSLISNGQKENFSVVIGANTLIPGFEDKLIGLGKGEEKDFTVTFPEDYFEKEYAGVDVKFEVNIKEIKEKELHALDDDFAKTLGEYNTLDELRELIRKQLKEENEKRKALKLREQVVDKLVESNEFEVPKTLVEKQLDYIVEETKKRVARQGGDTKSVSDEDMRENSRELAHKMVKRDLILGRIVEKEEFTVAEAELEEKYNDMAASVGKPVQSIKDHYKKLNAEQYIRDDILIQKVFNKITDTANIEEA
jgi:trigger factor